MRKVEDSVEAVLDLDEKSVYSHIAHESAEDIARIISSIDAERAKLRGEVIYYRDDWEDLIRERIAKGKRHTAFDFYNPELFDLWERKIRDAKKLKRILKAGYASFLIAEVLLVALSLIHSEPYFIIGVAFLPLLVFLRDYVLEKLDLIYYSLTQFFIDELRDIVYGHSLPPKKYPFKIFTGEYFGVSLERAGTELKAFISFKNGESKD